MRGMGHVQRGGAPENVHAFTTHAFSWPLNLGIQAPYWQAGGPSGFAGGSAGAVKPWPYMTGFKNFISGFPFGAASTLVRRPNFPNLGTGAVAFVPIGTVKKQTYTNRSY